MRDWMKEISLRNLIIVTSLLCLIAPLAVSLLIGSIFSNNLIRKQATMNANESLKLIRSQLINEVESMFKIANSIEFDAEIAPYLKSPLYYTTNSTVSIVTSTLGNLTNNTTGVFVTLLTKDGRFFTNYLLYDGFNPLQFTKEPWFGRLNSLAAYENYWLGLMPTYLDVVKQRDPYVISFARTISTAKRPYAYVIISISENRVRSLFANYTEQNIMLLDKSGTVISGSEHLGERFPYYEKLQEGSGNPIVEIGGINYLYVLEKLPFDDWTLVSLMPYENATEEVNRIYKMNFLLQIGFVALFLVVLVLLLRRFTHPIIRLGKVASSIESGNMSIRSEVRGSNEIGRLGRSFDHMLDRIEEMIEQIKREQEQARKSELSMLQAQISPHFLFNILNSIRMRIQLKGDRENADLISSLSQLLRMTIQRQDKMVTLREEVTIVTKYIELMNSTMREPISYQLDIREETEYELVPRFLLQPIIENALIHGLNRSSGTIYIGSELHAERLHLLVRDNGRGMTQEELERLRTKLDESKRGPVAESAGGLSGIGITNVYSRLHMLFGSLCAMTIESEPGRGTTVYLSIPLLRGHELD
ncbi:sensor histidine kinase [Paenibacillus sp. sptzw28]|uniref:cache domain-containing sensor histidine kinase n=1 Tax=Paenibacillus sp. sptzw28 TaxID=715179 RepID=UPI001C6DEAF3|nr:sensor histidine kinase [Paenibacillus sp. sptzw28]QYR22887.1 sensor histidine kinase [Paenibacillus sp. sptzw28]